MLQHELGGGQAAFKWHKRSRQDPLPPTYGPGQGTVAGQTVAALSDGKTGSPVEDTVEERGEGSLDGFREIETAVADLTLEGGRATTSLGTGTAPDSPNGRSSEQSPQNQDTDGKEPNDHVTKEPEAPLGHPGTSPPLTPTTPPPLTPTELARVRAQVASVVAHGNRSPAHVSQACSSYFIEPVEWMESALLGSVEGKVRERLNYHCTVPCQRKGRNAIIVFPYSVDPVSKVQCQAWLVQLVWRAVLVWAVGHALLPGPSEPSGRDQDTHPQEGSYWPAHTLLNDYFFSNVAPIVSELRKKV